MRRLFPFLSALLVLTLCGCFHIDTVVVVKPDGSGTVEMTQLVGPETLKMIEEMAASFGAKEEDQKGAPEDDLFKVEDLKNAAADMGEGTTFVSSEKVEKDGMKGRKTIYAFTDVNKLQLESKPSGPNQGPNAEAREDVKFKFEQLAGGNSLLTVVMPESKSKEEEDATEEGGEETHPGGAKEEEKEPTEAEMAQAKQMLKGLRFGVSVRVDGTLVKTNTPHVDGNKVTIFEMDFGAVVENADKMKELNQKKPETLEEMQELLKDFPGIKFPLTPEVTIEYSK